MTKINLLIVLFLFIFINLVGAQEIDLVGLVKKYPTLVSNYSTTNSQTSCKENKISLNSKAIDFLDQDMSNKEYTDLAARITKTPKAIYKWEIEVENGGNYLITKNGEGELEGFLNNTPVQVLNNGVITNNGSGKLWINLNKGNNILFLLANPKINNQISIISESRFELVKNEIFKKINSKEDQDWVVSQFLPNLASLRNGCHQHIISILTSLHKRNPFLDNEDLQNKFLKIVHSCKSEYEGYQIEKYILEKFPNTYLLLNK